MKTDNSARAESVYACNKVYHKFNVCAGCKVRRYCGEVCEQKDWDKHKQFCKAAK